MFDVYDRECGKFWSTSRRDALAAEISLAVVPRLFAGCTTMDQLIRLVETMEGSYHQGHIEGIVIRKETEQFLENRAKVVHPEFTQAIGEHWSRRSLEWNSLASSAPLRQRGGS